MKLRAWLSFLLALFPLLTHASELRISPDQALEIGKKIWKNESGGTIEGLTHWNAGEDFASLGIGHFIWYPKDKPGPFEESFPKLLQFLIENNIALPRWLRDASYCPWNSREQFFKDIQSARMRQLRKLLADTVALQAVFEANRLEAALPRILKDLSEPEQAHVRQQFYRMAEDPRGLYPLMDYVNFKGEGVSPTERYNGQGWGLLQVLQGMTGMEPGQPAFDEFARSAEEMLTRRVRNSPPERNEARWLPVWIRRLQTYR